MNPEKKTKALKKLRSKIARYIGCSGMRDMSAEAMVSAASTSTSYGYDPDLQEVCYLLEATCQVLADSQLEIQVLEGLKSDLEDLKASMQ